MIENNVFGLTEYSRRDLFEDTTDEIRFANGFYIVFEANGALAEQRDKIAKLEAELRHEKRKRCLALAKWCQALTAHFQMLENYKRRDRFRKWMFRFYNLADKLKEA